MRMTEVRQNSSVKNVDLRTISTVDWDQVSFENFLAEGSFGQLHVCMIMDTGFLATAKRTSKNFNEAETCEATMKELKNLRALHHENIVNFIGLSVSNEREVCLLMEHTYGKDLLLQLHQIRHDETRIHDAVPHLTRMMFQIATALEFLSARGIVHSDIQARNVYLSNHYLSTASPKLGTCGLSQAKHPENYALVNGKDVPIRWAAPEVLAEFYGDQISMDHLETVFNLDLNFKENSNKPRKSQKSEKELKSVVSIMVGDSDSEITDPECEGSLEEDSLGMELCRESRQNSKTMVWSYGVLLYECLSLGETPYAEMNDQSFMHSILMDKYRLQPPNSHPFSAMMEKVLDECLHFEARKRLDFGSILQNLSSIGIHKQEEVERALNRSESFGSIYPMPDWYQNRMQFALQA